MKKLIAILTTINCFLLSTIHCYGQVIGTTNVCTGWIAPTKLSIEYSDRKVVKIHEGGAFYMSFSLGMDFSYAPLEIYMDCKASLYSFKTKFPNTDGYTRHNLWEIKPGLGVQFSSKDLMRKKGTSPILRVGVNYSGLNLYKGMYGKDKGQLEKGINTIYGIGRQWFSNNILDAGIEGITGIILEFEVPHHSLFNKDYTSDGGYYYPFANVKSRLYTMYLTAYLKF